MNEWKEIRLRYKRELTENVIPFWMEHGIDRRYGGFFSFLDRDGSVYDTSKQMWMQWRAVWSFAALFNHPEFRREEYLECALRGCEFLEKYARKPDGSYHYMISREGLAISDSDGGAEIFSTAFAAIACAELYLATGEKSRRDEAESAIRVYRNEIAKAEAPRKLFPGARPMKKFAYRMILLHILNTFRKFPDGEKYDPEIEALISGLFLFRHPGSGLFFENIPADGSFDCESQAGRLINPGHSLEGLWFILEHQRVRFDRKIVDAALKAVKVALNYGWDAEEGGIVYFRDFLGKPLAQKECMLKAWWPQNESMIAALSAFEFSGEAFFADFFRKIDGWSWKHLRDGENNEWFAYAAVGGKAVHLCKGSRWKGFFHLPRALMVCSDILKRLEVGRGEGNEENTIP